MIPMSTEENKEKEVETKEKQQKISQKSVMNYLMVLFAAAFCLLILTLLMEQRNNDDIVDKLSDQVLYAQTNHSQVSTQRDKLETELAEAQNTIAQLEDEKSQLEQALLAADESMTQADQLRVAMEQLENIETLCHQGLYEDAKMNIENFEATSAFKLLQTQTQSIQPVWGDPFPSPWAQYETLKVVVAENIAD